MDFVNRLQGRAFNPATLLKFTPLHPQVQQHIVRVYATLACAVLCASAGATAHLMFNIGGTLTFLGALGSMIWLLFTPPTPYNQNKRLMMLGGVAFFDGACLGPLIGLALSMQAGLVITALLGTTSIFACFSAAALLSPRRSYLYLGGVLGSAMMLLMVMRLGGALFGRGALTMGAELYLGLLMFTGYVLFDTQVVVERASAGDLDHVQHALDLFVDFAAIFVRVLIILMKSSEDRERRERRKREQ